MLVNDMLCFTIIYLYLKIFFLCGPFLKSLFNFLFKIASALYFLVLFLAMGHGGSCLSDQGSHLHPLRWKAKSQPLDHQKSPFICIFFKELIFLKVEFYKLCPFYGVFS